MQQSDKREMRNALNLVYSMLGIGVITKFFRVMCKG